MPHSLPLSTHLLRPALRLLPAFLMAGSIFGAIIDISTGVASWSASGPNVAGTVAAANLGATPNGVWVPAPAGSLWVSSTPTDGSNVGTTGVPGTFTFRLMFSTAGLGGSLSYVMAADNQGSVAVFLDGVSISSFSHPGNALTDGASGASGCAFLPAGSALCTPVGTSQGAVGPGSNVTWGAGGAGVITIVGTVVNSQPPAPSPVGFLLSGLAITNDAATVPEVSTSWLMLIGGALVLLGAKRFGHN